MPESAQSTGDCIGSTEPGGLPSKFLVLCIEQIESAVSDTLKDIQSLESGALSCADRAQELSSALKRAQEKCRNCRCVDSEIVRCTDKLAADSLAAAMKLQLADRLAQRLSHTRQSLQDLSELLAPVQLTISDQDWRRMLIKDRERLTMSVERSVFDRHFPAVTQNDESGRNAAADNGSVFF